MPNSSIFIQKIFITIILNYRVISNTENSLAFILRVHGSVLKYFVLLLSSVYPEITIF